MATAIATQQQPIYPASFPSSKEQRAQHLQYLQSFAYQSTQVRSKFFQRIGITSPLQASASKHRRNNSTRDILSTNRFEVPLKYKYDHKKKSKEQHQIQQLPSSLMKILPSHPEGKKKRSVGFAETVTVAPIPMRNEYSDRIKAKLWTDRVELCEAVGKLTYHNMISYVHIVSDIHSSKRCTSHTVCSLDLLFFINEHLTERNLTEFASENYNWRNVYHEEEMYICKHTQELIHPIHIEHGLYSFGTGGHCQRSSYYDYDDNKMSYNNARSSKMSYNNTRDEDLWECMKSARRPTRTRRR